MKILITGAGGMLGTDLSASLRAHFTTVGVGRSHVTHLPIPYVMRDLSNPRLTFDIVQREKADLIFHCAAMTDVDGCQTNRFQALQGNLDVARNVVEASNQTEAFIVFFSTDYVFDGQKQGEYDESDNPHPINVYGETKFLAERYIQQRARHFVIFRLSWLYGRQGRSFPRTILELASKNKEIKVVRDQQGRPTYTKDVAEALTALLKKNEKAFYENDREVFHLANQGSASRAEFASYLLKESYLDSVTVKPVSSAEVARPAPRPTNSILCLKKAESRLGLRLRPWQEAATDFIGEYEAKGTQAHGTR